MGNFAENLNLGNRFRPPLEFSCAIIAPSYEHLGVENEINQDCKAV